MLAGAGAVAAGVFAVWTRYADSMSAQAEYPYVELRLSKSAFITFWYFGDLAYRLNPAHWLKGAWRFAHATMGALPVVLLLVLALIRKGNRLPKLWLGAACVTALVFTHLVLEHWHYYLMCCPAVAMLCGTTLARWDEIGKQEIGPAWLRAGLAGAVLVGACVTGVLSMKIALQYDYYPEAMSAILREHTKPEDKLIFYKCDPHWGGEELFRSGRKGLSVMALRRSAAGPSPKGLFDLLENEADLQRLKSLGYNKLVMMSQSPVMFAVQAASPGRRMERTLYPQTVSAKVDAWPVVYRSEDILIKEIP